MLLFERMKGDRLRLDDGVAMEEVVGARGLSAREIGDFGDFMLLGFGDCVLLLLGFDSLLWSIEFDRLMLLVDERRGIALFRGVVA